MLWITVDNSSGIPMIKQVYSAISQQILKGQLKSGEKLPSSRELAAELKVSRNVILEAYDNLQAEGYIETRPCSGTYVAQGAQLQQLQAAEVIPREQIVKEGSGIKEVIDFRSGLPALDLFPRRIWGKIAKEVCEQADHNALGYSSPEGRYELREVLTYYLLKSRGIRCNPEQILITSGASQAFTLINKLLLIPGDVIIMEDPTNKDIRRFFKAPGITIHPIPVDEGGMRTEFLPVEHTPRLIFVTPSHQFPLGGIMPIQRRVELINYSRMTGCYIVEDDYDSEFRYDGPPISSLQGLDSERVIYVGTFSKILSPALRMGYLVLPPCLISRCRKVKFYTDLHSPSLEQLTLACFIREGHLQRHIARMRKYYGSLREKLIRELKASFPGVRVLGNSTGLHLIAEFPGLDFSDQLIKKISDGGLQVYPVEFHALLKGKNTDKIIIGYGHLGENEITEGIRRLRVSLSSG